MTDRERASPFARTAEKVLPGFCWTVVDGKLDLSIVLDATGEARSLVSVARAGRYGVVVLGRLHYIDAWRVMPSCATDANDSDAALALAAFRASGPAALERFEGEYALIVWDLAERKCHAMRDPMGCYPLFYCERGGAFGIATRIDALSRIQPSFTLSDEYLSDYLARPLLGQTEPAQESTCYREVNRILPGTIASFDLDQGRAAVRRYWHWMPMSLPERISDDELAECAGEILRDAVAERVCGHTAAHLSGGMDSTAIALLARDCAFARGAPPIMALSLIYNRLASLKGETAYVRAAYDGQDHLTPVLVRADDLLTYDSFTDAPAIDEPVPDLFDLANDRALAAAAAAAGADTLLSGAGGDEVFDVMPFSIAADLRSGRLWRAWRESARWAHGRNANAWTVFFRYGLSPLLPPVLRAGPRAMLTAGRVSWRNQAEGTLPPWIREPFARTHDLRGRALRQLRVLYRADRHPGISVLLAQIQCRVGNPRGWSVAAAHGLSLSHPFLDARMLRFALALRLRVRQDPARQKPLLARAMRNSLPQSILDRRSKMHFNEVYYRGLRKNCAAIEAMIMSAPSEVNEMFDRNALVQALRQTALGVEFSGGGAMRLDATLSLVKWLSMRGTRRIPNAVLRPELALELQP